VQIVDTDVSDEEGCGGSKRENDLQGLTMIEIPTPPPFVVVAGRVNLTG
jgi:hypothetical protein